jgi:hypothetical protein
VTLSVRCASALVKVKYGTYVHILVSAFPCIISTAVGIIVRTWKQILHELEVAHASNDEIIDEGNKKESDSKRKKNNKEENFITIR